MKLTGKQRSYLRSLAHQFPPAIIIGKNGLTDASITHIKELLDKHELIKIKFLSTNKEYFENKLTERTNSFIVGSIGKIFILYKESKDKDNRKIILSN